MWSTVEESKSSKPYKAKRGVWSESQYGRASAWRAEVSRRINFG